jgi:hypothetical protein
MMSNAPLLGRSKLLARIQAGVSRRGDPSEKLPTLMGFLRLSDWLVPYVKDVFRKRARYRTYAKGETGVFAMGGRGQTEVRMAIAADWGTGTLESETVGGQMADAAPHFTVHLGDVYHLGDIEEIDDNCLGKASKQYGGVTWPLGSHGSFALMGNHEMYSGGQGFFRRFMPLMGTWRKRGEIEEHQRAGFFCLEGEHWVVLGLDTGYHSGGLVLLGMVSGVRDIQALNVDAHFDEKMMRWLRTTLEGIEQRAGRKKTVVMMTHHQPLSAFEQPFPAPAKQLGDLDWFQGREFVWFYGHEHRFTVYQKSVVAPGVLAWPRCIGHGGMPVSVSKMDAPDERVAFYDARTHAIDCDHPQTKVGYNGHALLRFEGETLTVEYRDIVGNRVLLEETFEADGSGGLRYKQGAVRELRPGRRR